MPEWGIEIIFTAFSLLLAAVIWYTKRDKLKQEKINDKQQEQIEKLSGDLQEYKLEASDRYVLKDDFIRAISQTDRKLDKIYDEVIKLNKAEAKT